VILRSVFYSDVLMGLANSYLNSSDFDSNLGNGNMN